MEGRFSHRPATEADYPSWARLFVELGVDDPPAPLEKWLADFAHRILLLEEADRVIGFVMYNGYEGLGHVVSLAVAPEARGRGAGRALMEIVAERFHAAGCTEW